MVRMTYFLCAIRVVNGSVHARLQVSVYCIAVTIYSILFVPKFDLSILTL